MRGERSHDGLLAVDRRMAVVHACIFEVPMPPVAARQRKVRFKEQRSRRWPPVHACRERLECRVRVRKALGSVWVSRKQIAHGAGA